MNKKKFEPAFIPCGDSFEKMAEINDDELDTVVGGVGAVNTAGTAKGVVKDDNERPDNLSAPEVVILPEIPAVQIGIE